MLESPTWRASRDWGRLLGYSGAALAQANRQAVEVLTQLRDEYGLPIPGADRTPGLREGDRSSKRTNHRNCSSVKTVRPEVGPVELLLRVLAAEAFVDVGDHRACGPCWAGGDAFLTDRPALLSTVDGTTVPFQYRGRHDALTSVEGRRTVARFTRPGGSR